MSLASKRKWLVFSCLSTVFILLSLAFVRRRTWTPSCIPTPLHQGSTERALLTSRNLHLLLPVNARTARASPYFCKTLLSALVHGYQPTILNWDVDGDASFMQKMKVIGEVPILHVW
jgi:hypothetical protein